jgi:hypothetical protein
MHVWVDWDGSSVSTNIVYHDAMLLQVSLENATVLGPLRFVRLISD